MKKNFPVIGLGASAGGLEPLEVFFEQVSLDTIFAYVIIQHLAPNHKSLMDELLARHTQLPIFIIQDGMEIQPGNIYLNPPKSFVEINNGKFVLSEKADRKLSFPISSFFQSLSKEYQDNASAVVLSGTGSDGSDGIKFIKEKGGFVLVQDPDEAKFNGMPNNAINTGSVDKICSIENMHLEIEKLYHNKFQFDNLNQQSGSAKELITKILRLTHEHIAVDFTGYKYTTVSRRIARRMSLLNFSKMNEYYKYLMKNPAEAGFLGKEILIGVTRFFRDEEAFEQLKVQVIPQLIQQNAESKTIRIWVTACSTGEEAFTIAILLKDYLRKNKLQYDVSIFATDLDKEAIRLAGNRVFPESITAEIPPEYFNLYFTPHRNGYSIVKEVREMIVFSSHNLIQDPPFNKIDLISCRNLLIYLNEPLQQQIFNLFQYSLKTNGYLFLGSSETLGEAQDYFMEVDKKHKIFINLENKKIIHRPKLGLSRIRNDYDNSIPAVQYPIHQNKGKVLQEIQQALIQEYVPDSLVIDEQFNLLHTTGNTHRWLALPPGEITSNVFKMMPEMLAIPVEVVAGKVLSTGQAVTLTDIAIPDRLKPFFNPEETLQIHIQKKEIDGGSPYLFLRFESKSTKNSAVDFEKININTASKDRINLLERELRINRENLQTTIEELESSNEELQAANEELQSSNEELESVNEELYTVNSEYQQKNTELAQSNDDLNTLIQSTDIAILFLDSQLNIRRFTPAIKNFLDLMPHDVGRNISHFRGKIPLENFMEHVEAVLEKLTPYESNVKDIKGREFLIKIAPFKTNRNEIQGVVLVFVDVTQAIKLNKKIALSDKALADLKIQHSDQSEILQLITENMQDMVCIITQHGKIEYCTISAHSVTGFPINKLLGSNLFKKIPEPNQLQQLRAAIQDFKEDKESGLIEFQFKKANGTLRWMEATLKPINNADNADLKFLMTIRDVHQRNIREDEYRRNALIAEQTSSAVIITDPEEKITFVNKAFEFMTGYLEDEVIGKKPGPLLQGKGTELEAKQRMAEAVQNKMAFDVDVINYTKSGHKHLVNIKAEPLYDRNDRFIGFFSIQNDISKNQESFLQIQELNRIIKEQNQRLSDANNALEEFAYVASHDLKTPVRNIKRLLELMDKKGESFDEKKKEEFHKIIRDSATELHKMIENLLEYSRSGRVQEDVEEVDTLEITNNVIKQFEKELQALDGNITLDLSIPKIKVYPILFKRLLTNLVGNAIKYRSEEPPKIVISCQTYNDKVLFQIQDNGIGIPENQYENVFKIFKTIKHNNDSNGIGLSVCKKIIELHGGNIWLQPNIPIGLNVNFTV